MQGGYAPGSGLAGMLKDGSKHITSADSAVLRNIDACKQLGNLLATSLGPSGRKKLVVNRMGRLMVTSDASTIVRELEVEHPAAKMIVMASQAQDRDAGDASGLVCVLASKLLEGAEDLLRMGLHTTEIADGFEKAGMQAQKILDTLTVHKVSDLTNKDAVAEVLRTPIAAKQFGLEDFIAPLVAEACISVLPKNINHFSVENVRVTKILGGAINDSSIIRGAVLTGDTAGTIKHITTARIAVYTCDIDTSSSETKGTVLLHSAKEFMNYTRSEEDSLEARIKAVSEAGVNVIVSPKFGEMAMHFLEKYKIMAVKAVSKFDLRRVARTCGAIALAQLEPPTTDEIGRCDAVEVEEIGSTKCTVLRQHSEGSRIATILLRASTDNLLEDLERAVDDAVNVYRGMSRDPRFTPGAGATEMQISCQLQDSAAHSSGLDQYAIKKYAQAIEIVPRNISDNAGGDTNDMMTKLLALHTKGNAGMGVDAEEAAVVDAVSARIFDLLTVKNDAIRLATEAACTVLRVDQIIMAKTAGGPKPRDMLPGDANDEMMA